MPVAAKSKLKVFHIILSRGKMKPVLVAVLASDSPSNALKNYKRANKKRLLPGKVKYSAVKV